MEVVGTHSGLHQRISILPHGMGWHGRCRGGKVSTKVTGVMTSNTRHSSASCASF